MTCIACQKAKQNKALFYLRKVLLLLQESGIDTTEVEAAIRRLE